MPSELKNTSIVVAPDFKTVHIDGQEVAKALQAYLDHASKITGVDLDSINLGVNPLPADTSKLTLAKLLESGMKLFDAMVWLTAGRPASHPLVEDPSLTKDSIPSFHEVAKAVFYCYFFILTQARYPFVGPQNQAPKVPAFLNQIMELKKPQEEYVKLICSFPPVNFDMRWVRYVKFENFGHETISRFGLGVAGYRLFGPFKLYTPRAGHDAALDNAIAFASTVARKPPTWDVHPVTRNPTILTKRGNLNKNLGNLILDVFSEADINEMVQAKVLYQYPIREPTHRNYRTWNADDDISGTNYIFPTPQ